MRGAHCPPAARREPAREDDEIAMVRDLLLAHRSTPGHDSRWLAAMIARRAMEAFLLPCFVRG